MPLTIVVLTKADLYSNNELSKKHKGDKWWRVAGKKFAEKKGKVAHTRWKQ